MEEELTITQVQNASKQLSPQMYSAGSCDDLLLPVVEKKPVLVLADSMGEFLSVTDQYFTPVVKASYNYEWMAQDVVDDVINVQRYKNILIWAGAHAIHQLDMEQIELDLKGLINVIVPRNRKAIIYISTLIPKPRENHLTTPKFRNYNSTIKRVVLEYQKNRARSVLLEF